MGKGATPEVRSAAVTGRNGEIQMKTQTSESECLRIWQEYIWRSGKMIDLQGLF
jgi:hypothetical protein